MKMHKHRPHSQKRMLTPREHTSISPSQFPGSVVLPLKDVRTYLRAIAHIQADEQITPYECQYLGLSSVLACQGPEIQQPGSHNQTHSENPSTPKHSRLFQLTHTNSKRDGPTLAMFVMTLARAMRASNPAFHARVICAGGGSLPGASKAIAAMACNTAATRGGTRLGRWGMKRRKASRARACCSVAGDEAQEGLQGAGRKMAFHPIKQRALFHIQFSLSFSHAKQMCLRGGVHMVSMAPAQG
eukprot:1157687-Pelagomonas_calceolata.AAC.8